MHKSKLIWQNSAKKQDKNILAADIKSYAASLSLDIL